MSSNQNNRKTRLLSFFCFCFLPFSEEGGEGGLGGGIVNLAYKKMNIWGNHWKLEAMVPKVPPYGFPLLSWAVGVAPAKRVTVGRVPALSGREPTARAKRAPNVL